MTNPARFYVSALPATALEDANGNVDLLVCTDYEVVGTYPTEVYKIRNLADAEKAVQDYIDNVIPQHMGKSGLTSAVVYSSVDTLNRAPRGTRSRNSKRDVVGEITPYQAVAA